MRAVTGSFALAYLVYTWPSITGVAAFAPGQFKPVGLAGLLNTPLPSVAPMTCVVIALALGVAFTLGAVFRLTGPAFALLLLWVTTYRSSWGMVFHTDNLLTLHVMLLGVSRAADALSWDAWRAQRRGQRAPAEPSFDFDWPLRAMSIVTAICYVLAGIAKLKLSGGEWLGGELLRAQIANDNLRKLELGTQISPVGPWLVRHRSVFPGLATMTLFVELGAPLALLRRRFAYGWAAAAWGFHVGVLLLMSIGFVYQLSGVAYLSFFPLERAWRRMKSR